MHFLASNPLEDIHVFISFNLSKNKMVFNSSFFSLSYVRFSKWTTNDSYGEMIEALVEDQMDIGAVLFIYSLERFPYLKQVIGISEFR